MPRAKGQFKPEWAVKLSQALHAWGKRSGYPQISKLNTELGLALSAGRWGSISAGDGVIDQTEAYAKLYLFTELGEADPRTIPPIRKLLPHGGETSIKRGWTGEDWQRWLLTEEAQEIRSKVDERQKRNDEYAAPEKAVPWEIGRKTRETSGVQEEAVAILASAQSGPTRDDRPPGGTTAGQLVGTLVDNFLASLGEQLAQPFSRVLQEEIRKLTPQTQATVAMTDEYLDRLAKMIAGGLMKGREEKEQGTAPPVDETVGPIKDIAVALTLRLKPYLKGRKEDRDRLMEQAGTELYDLVRIAFPLTRDANEREDQIRLMKEFSQK